LTFKRIIPAIASTNAIISASCATEVFKIITQSSSYLKNYMMYSGIDGVYTNTFNYDKNPDCAVCGSALKTLKLKDTAKVQNLLDALVNDAKLQLTRPSLSTVIADKTVMLYMQNPPHLEKHTRPNLDKTVGEFLHHGGFINITDPNLPGIGIEMQIFYEPN